jgi:hypothetical protein
MGRLKRVRAKHEIGIMGRGRLGIISWTQIKSNPGLRSMFDGDSPFKEVNGCQGRDVLSSRMYMISLV